MQVAIAGGHHRPRESYNTADTITRFSVVCDLFYEEVLDAQHEVSTGTARELGGLGMRDRSPGGTP
jgi:hypothetical protein